MYGGNGTVHLYVVLGVSDTKLVGFIEFINGKSGKGGVSCNMKTALKEFEKIGEITEELLQEFIVEASK